MIAVIADDFSGAAELAGIGWQYGLTVQIVTVADESTDADLLVIDADTRSTDAATAVQKIERISAMLARVKPEWIYKKTDSVLRGHVAAELNAQMKVMGITRALLVPANPYLGRTIRNGIYFLNDRPVHESSFSSDPEFAITSSEVGDMLKANVHIAAVNAPLAASGIVVGEASEMDDLRKWAAKCTGNTLPAGAAGFFSALLFRKHKKQRSHSAVVKGQGAELFVSETTFKKSCEVIAAIKATGGPVNYLGENEVSHMLNKHGKAIIAIDPGKQQQNAVALREETAKAVEQVLNANRIGELFIEGGSTARAIFDRLGFAHFQPVQELAPGVVKMTVKQRAGMFITVKPGSYAWPAGTWDF